MNLFKKFMASLLLLALMVGYIPPAAASTNTAAPTADTNMVVQGENDIGNILAADINEAQEDLYASQDGSAILDVTINGQTATVSYSLQQEAVVLVGIYTQDGMELLTESRSACTAGEGSVILTFPDALPQYFYVSAFILDPVSNKPLCSAYRNPMYTQSMQELLDSTVDDYDPELVMNLDDSEETNFLVFAENTTQITEKEGYNIIRSIDDEAGTYIIDNADKQFTGLKVGDIIRYPYGDNELLIVKVASISVSGSTVTLTGQTPEAEEVFQAVKIEGSSNPEDVTFDESSCDDGLTYAGKQPVKGSGSVNINKSKPFNVNKEIDKGPFSVSIKGTLEISLGVNVDYYLTISDQYVDFSTDLGVKAELSITGKLEWSPKKLQFNVSFWGIFSAGIEVGFEFGVEIEGKFTATYNHTIGFVYDNGDFRNTSQKPVFDTAADISASLKLGVSVGVNVQLLSGLAKVGLSAGAEFSIKAELEDGPTETGGRVHHCDLCLGVSIDFNFKLWIDLGLVWGLVDEDFNLVDLPVHICDFYYSFDTKQGGFGTCPNKDPMLIIFSDPSTDLEIIAGGKTLTANTGLLGLTFVYVPAGNVRIIATKENRQGYEDITVTESTTVQVYLSYQGYIGDIRWHLSSDGRLTLTGNGDSILPAFLKGDAPWDDLPITISDIYINDCIVADNAFAGKENINTVHLQSDAVLGANVFKGCPELYNVYLHENTVVGESAFEGCEKLAYISFPQGSCALGKRAFANCTALDDIHISCPDLSVGESAFEGCTTLAAVYTKYMDTWMAIRFANETANPLYYAGELYVKGNLLTTLSTGDPIGDYTFVGCTSLTEIEFDEELTSIGKAAFKNCTALTDIYFYGDPPAIATDAFTGVTATAYHLDYNTTWQDTHRLSYGGNLSWDLFTKALCFGTLNNTVGWILFENGSLTFSGTGEISYTEQPIWYQYKNLITSVTIGEGITAIGKNTFPNLPNLHRITIPSTLNAIGEASFEGTPITRIDIPNIETWCQISGASRLLNPNATLRINGNTVRNIVIPGTVEKIRSGVFKGYELYSVVISEGVTSIDSYAFEDATIHSITFPSTLTSIGDFAFYDCKLPSQLTFPYNLKTIGSHAFAHAEISKISFSGNTEIGDCAFMTYHLKEVDLRNITSIGYGAFMTTQITRVDLPYNDIVIGDEAFAGCTNIASINFRNYNTIIGKGAFRDCTGIKSITFPSYVTQIGSYAFMNCTGLAQITFLGSAPTIIPVPASNMRPFENVNAIVTYPNYNSWTDTVKILMGGNLTWVVSGGSSGGSSSQEPQVRTDQFTGLIPGQEYLYISVLDAEAPELLAHSNLLYINQGTADESGMITFQYNAPEGMATGHGLIFGGGKLRISDAQITLSDISPSDELVPIQPLVVLDGKTLIEGADYTLTGDLLYSKIGHYSFTIRGINDYCDSISYSFAVGNPALELVTAAGADSVFETLNAALAVSDNESFVRLTASLTEDLVLEENAYLDLNGHVLTGNVTISDNATLYVFDSATADFTADRRGKLIGTVSGNLARTALTPTDAYGASYKYLTLLEDENTYSFHRIYLSIHSAVLTPYRDYGDYIGTDLNYKAAFKCDDMVAQYITAYGADFSLNKTVSLDFLTRPIEPGAESMNERKTTLRGTLRSDNLGFQNAANAEAKPTVQLYIRINDGLQEQVNAKPVELSLREVVEQLSASTNYTVAQKTALANMYNTHKGLLDSWGDSVESIRNYAKYFGYNATVTWTSPLTSCRLTSPFGYRVHPVYGNAIFHNGVDLSAPQGTPIYAVRSGTVTTAAHDSSSGYHVIIDHYDGYDTRYLHMTHYIVSAGQYVEQGQIIGYVGSTGASTSPHLHLGLYYNGTAINPLEYISLPN